MTTGFATAMIAFDMDVDVPHRRIQPEFYGYIPNDYNKKTICFGLMTIISSIHNLSRSFGLALLATSTTGTGFAVIVTISEMAIYIIYKVIRGDFLYFIRVYGAMGVATSLAERVLTKFITGE